MDEEKRYREARKRAKKLREFYSSLMGFISFAAVFFIVNGLTGWLGILMWVVVLWAIGLGFQAYELFNPFCGENGKLWEERKARELMNGEKPKRNTTADDYFKHV